MDLGLSLAMAFAGSSSFKKAPLLLKESLIFPYRKGYAFCRRLTAQGDWDRVDHAFREPPRSTEQILHPEKYLAALPDEPVALTFGAGDPLAPAEWSFAKENVLGEFSIEVLLRPQLGRAWSSRAAAGWDGDLYRVYRQKEKEPRRAALIWVSAWDSPEEAEEFAAALAEQQRLVRNEKSAAVPEGVPAPVALWGGANGLSGVWRRESRVWFLAGVPEGELSRVLDWSLEVESGPKTARERLPPDRVIRVREF
jgi:hypothetical protein